MALSSDEYLLALGFAALPAISNMMSGVLAEVLPTSKRTLELALHIAVGVLLAIAAVELVPRIIQAKPDWIPLLALFVGDGFFILTNQLAVHLQKRVGQQAHRHIAWILFLSTSIHLTKSHDSSLDPQNEMSSTGGCKSVLY